MHKYSLFTDGGSRGNPGPAAIGAVLYNEDKDVVWEISEYIGEKTNNQAEYQAIIAALERLVKEKKDNIKCYLDSQLVVKQINREYRVKNENMKPLFETALHLLLKFENIEFHHVKREKNKHADKLVNKALDKK